MLMEKANTRCDTSARVVWLKDGDYSPQLISTEDPNTLFTELKKVIHCRSCT